MAGDELRPSLGRMQGRVAIVTGGGTSGPPVSVGEALCMLFAHEGAKVAIVDINEPAAEKTAATIRAAGGDAVAITGDVSKEFECTRVVRTVISRWGRLDVLINSAVLTLGKQVADIEIDQWDKVMDVNVKGTLLMSKHAIRNMPNGGSIINLSSIASTRPPVSVAYSVSKGAIETLTKATAVQHGAQGIRCNAIQPGELWAPMQTRNRTGEELDRIRQQAIDRTMLKTEGTAWDAAYAALFLASDDARWITGQVITVDGGSGFWRWNAGQNVPPVWRTQQ